MQSFFVPAGGECREKKRRNKIVSKNNPSKPQQAEDGGFRQEISLFGGVSIIGGIGHNIGQISIAALVFSIWAVMCSSAAA